MPLLTPVRALFCVAVLVASATSASAIEPELAASAAPAAQPRFDLKWVNRLAELRTKVFGAAARPPNLVGWTADLQWKADHAHGWAVEIEPAQDRVLLNCKLRF
jgi:hypothetical protein